MEQLFNPYSVNCSLVDGKGLTNEDFVNGNNKAIVGIGVFNDLYVDGKKKNELGYTMSYDNEFQKIAKPIIEINDNKYEIFGVTSDNVIMAPISSLKDNDEIATFFPSLITFCYDLPVTVNNPNRQQIEKVISKLPYSDTKSKSKP